MKRNRNIVAVVITLALCAVTALSATVSATPAAADDCIQVDMTVQLNQYPLMPDLAKRFNGSDAAEVDGRCIRVVVSSKSSGEATTLLEHGWPDEEENGTRPVVWSPAATAWAQILDERLAEQNRPEMAPPGPYKADMVSPLVIAMPKTMAQALGWPDQPIGYSDILALVTDPRGWGAKGQEWGAFKLGKTNPNFSTSGLSSLIAEYYAFTGKDRDLTLEDVDDATVKTKATQVESAVVHYGDTTLTFLNNLYAADRRDAPLGAYASAVAVEEQSVVNYNRGNPDGKLDPGEQPRKPHEPLVAIYPKEGTLFSDNPFIILDAKWVSRAEKRAAAVFGDFVQRPVNQRRVLQYGFRPGNATLAPEAPIVAANGLDPDQPKTRLEVPEPSVLAGLIQRWDDIRKGARVLVVVDVSGSMAEPVSGSGGKTKLALAKDAASGALAEFRADDEVGLWAFTTQIGPPEHPDYKELAPVGPIGADPSALRAKIAALGALMQTPLYDVTEHAFDAMLSSYEPTRINAVVLLSDGKANGALAFDDLVDHLASESESSTGAKVRIFTIAYGKDADVHAMKTIAEATNGAYYDATDASSIVDVLNAVISNF